MSVGLPFDGLSVVVTGEVPGLDRAQAQAAVVALGGKAMGSVSSKTSLVVVGEGAGVSKMAKVRLHQVPVLTGEMFAALAADPGSWDGTPVGVPVESVVAVEPPREPVVLGTHLLTQSVVYPGGVREIRVRCSCGVAWRGTSLETIQTGVCPAADGALAGVGGGVG